MDDHLSFPDGFLWGAATAACQVEGGAEEGGRGLSIWDDFSRAGNCFGKETPNVSCDHYHCWREDVEIVRSMGLSSYRLSISWSRVLPTGAGCKPCEEGISFYRSLLQALNDAGVEPMVTLYHWDLPSALEARGGWLDKEAVRWFEDYARLCFQRFGDLVRLWLTFSEPFIACVLGYGVGVHAPGRSSEPGVEPYIAGHHMLLAHAFAVRLYKREFERKQDGQIGIALTCDWFFPEDPFDEDQLSSCKRALDFSFGWFAEPLRTGEYPKVMRETVGERLPQFSGRERAILTKTYDFLGVNYYTSRVFSSSWRGLASSWRGPSGFSEGSLFSDLGSGLLSSIGAALGASHVLSDLGGAATARPEWQLTDAGTAEVPDGLRLALVHVCEVYRPRGGVYVTENGAAFPEASREEALADGGRRVNFFAEHIAAVAEAVELCGADVRGYYAWSLLDGFEWAHATSKRYGLAHVDFDDPKKRRHLKPVAQWYAQVASSNAIARPAARASVRRGQACIFSCAGVG